MARTTRLSAGVRGKVLGLVEAGAADRGGRPGAWIADQSICTRPRHDRIDAAWHRTSPAPRRRAGRAQRRITELEAELRALRRALERV